MTVEPPIEERLRPKRTDARWIVEYPGRDMVPPPAAEDAGCRDVDERPQHGNTHDEGCADQWPIGPITVLVKKTDQRNLAHSILEIQPNAPYKMFVKFIRSLFQKDFALNQLTAEI